MVTCPVKPVMVLLLASCAVILMLNGVPAVCVAMFPPPAASTLNCVTLLLNVTVTDWLLPVILKLQVLRSEEHTSELQSPCNIVCRLLLEKKKITNYIDNI